jgi:hypothetical protein
VKHELTLYCNHPAGRRRLFMPRRSTISLECEKGVYDGTMRRPACGSEIRVHLAERGHTDWSRSMLASAARVQTVFALALLVCFPTALALAGEGLFPVAITLGLSLALFMLSGSLYLRYTRRDLYWVGTPQTMIRPYCIPDNLRNHWLRGKR